MCRLECEEREEKVPRTEHCVRLESDVDEEEFWAFVDPEQKRRQRRMRVMSRVPSRSLNFEFDIAMLMTCGDEKIIKTQFLLEKAGSLEVHMTYTSCESW